MRILLEVMFIVGPFSTLFVTFALKLESKFKTCAKKGFFLSECCCESMELHFNLKCSYLRLNQHSKTRVEQIFLSN